MPLKGRDIKVLKFHQIRKFEQADKKDLFLFL